MPQTRKDGCEETIHERRILLLTKSKDALYLTLDRIRGDRFHVGIQFTLPVLHQILITVIVRVNHFVDKLIMAN